MKTPKYNVGDKVLAYVYPLMRLESEAWLPGTITENLGESEVKQGLSHKEQKYKVSLEIGGSVSNFESYILLNPLERRVLH